MYLCRVSFLTTLDIYMAYFKGRHMREYKENICKKWSIPYSLWKKLLRLCALGFCNQVLFNLHCWWSEELYSQHFLQVGELVTYWEPCIMVSHVLGSVQKGWHSYIEKFRDSKAVEGFCCKFIYGDCRVYGQRFCTKFETSLYYSELLFGKVSPQVFYYETSLFHWFS